MDARAWLLLGVLVLLGSGLAPPEPTFYGDRLGVTHWDGRYDFTDRPILVEGADRIWDLGARVIKVELDVRKVPGEYASHTTWPEAETVRDLVATPPYVAAIDRPWAWVNFQVGTAQTAVPVTWCDGMSDAETTAERQAFHDLAAYLLRHYAGTGIHFLLDNWEGDNALDRNPCAPDGGGGASWPVRDGMVRWLSARQAGIEQAVAEVGEHGVWVYGGVECNSTPDHVWPPGTGSQCGDNVVPWVDPPPDLCGLSAYRRAGDTDMTAALGWLRQRCNERRAHPSRLGDDDVYLAEFGAAGNEVGDDAQLAIASTQATSALANHAVLAIYWQLFSNECTHGCPNDPVLDGDVRGFWLVKPEPRATGGTATPTWGWMAEVLAGNRTTPAASNAPAHGRLVARATGTCVVGERLVPCDPDDGGQGWPPDGSRGWRLDGVPGSGVYVTVRDPTTGDCLTATDEGAVTTRPCDGGYAQMFWRRP